MLTVLASQACQALPAVRIAEFGVRDTDAVNDLRLPVTTVLASGSGERLALLITGDGGYVEADRSLATSLAQRGISVVALDARAYLSHKTTPEKSASDMSRLLRAYMHEWQRERIVLVGYSRGADIMSFIANRMDADLRERVELIAYLGLAARASFEFHWRDLLLDTSRPTDLPVLPELERLRGVRMLCVYGEDDRESLCHSLQSSLIQVVARNGSHRISAREGHGLAQLIVDALPK